jgi:hypothetical protein
MSDNGINVEGLAVAGGKLFAGLRAPTLDGKAFIVTIDADQLFDEDASINEGNSHAISVQLGPGSRDPRLSPTCAESTPHSRQINALAKKLALHFW